MPLTDTGRTVLSEMKKKYGEKGEAVFYASIKKGVPGSAKWHGKESQKKGSKGRGKSRYSEVLAHG